jgi:hypothetical protein
VKRPKAELQRKSEERSRHESPSVFLAMSRSMEGGSVEDGERDFYVNIQRMHITLRGENLDAMDPSIMGGKSDPYVIFKVPRSTDKPLPDRLLGALISRSTPEETDVLGNHTLHKTEVVYNSLNPVWKPMMLYLDKRKDMANDAKIILEVWDKVRHPLQVPCKG